MNANRTRIIFTVALVLLVSAMVYGLNTKNETPVPPKSVDVTVKVEPNPVKATVTPNASASAGDTLTLSASLENKYVAQGDSSAYMLLDVDASSAASANVALDLAIVIDRSGSMAGDKLEGARRAARALINKLRPGDRATVVSYGSDVSVEVPLIDVTSQRFQFTQAIDRLIAAGGTNISGGLETARDRLSHNPIGNRVRRVILLSDGHATAGVTDGPGLARIAESTRNGGISVTSMGLGVDYNEISMTEIARQGGGNYYFIEESTNLFSTFEKELNTLTASVARDTILEIDLKPGVKVKNVFGFAFRQAGNKLTIPMSEFWAGQNKSLLVELELKSLSSDTLLPVAEATLLYKDLVRDRLQRHAVSLSAASTNNHGLLDTGLNNEVLVRREQILTANAYEEATKRYEQGRGEEARKILNSRSSALKSNSVKLRAPKLAKEADDLNTMLQTLGYVDSGSKEGRATIKRNRARRHKLLLAK